MAVSSTSLIEFPCNFTLKVMGQRHPEFEHTVLSCVQKHAPETQVQHMRLRNSSQGNYLGISITAINIQNQNQLDNIYRELTGNRLVKVVL